MLNLLQHPSRMRAYLRKLVARSRNPSAPTRGRQVRDDKAMSILGIDPGIGRMGWALIENQRSKIKYQKCGCVETGARETTDYRLLRIYDFLEKLVREEKPDVLAIEELYFAANAKTALVVGEARGVILLAAAKNKLPVYTYTPLQVKQALTGYGRADKNQIQQMVKTILKLKEIPKPDDAADALAIAITHAFSYKMRR